MVTFKTQKKLLDPGSLIGPFKIEKPLPKKGGMSELYLAHFCDNANRKVALKLNRGVEINDGNPRNVYQDLLRKEVRMLRELRHPGIVRIYPFAFEKEGKAIYTAKTKINGIDLWYYVMEYLSGENLENHLAAISHMPVEWAVEFFYQLLVTVQFMHQHGYAHCDLKPENIMLREPPQVDRIPQPILIDFGCVEPVDNYIQTPCSTPSYSPPEVLLALQRADIKPEELGLKPDKIDIWSLGAIFFALLTGKAMFAQKNRSEITSSVVNGEIAKIQQYRPELHSSLDMLLSVMMQRRVEERAELDDVITAIEEKISSVRPPRLPCAF